jgi:HAD superfamily hydrolase (TIGR01484 family)
MEIKVFASDYDGTIRFENGISAEDLKMIRLWRAAGNKFGIVTGRSLGSLYHELPLYQLEYDFLIGNNGGIIVDHEHTIIDRQLIDFQEVTMIIDQLNKEAILNYYIDDGIVSGQHFYEDYHGIFSGFKKVPAQEVLQQQLIAGIKVKFATSDEAKAFCERIQPSLVSAVGFINKNFVDIVGAKASKYYGVKMISEYLDTKLIYCMGDADNDLSMLRGFNGYTLHHAADDIKSSASACFGSLAEAIKRIMKKDE